MELYRIQWQDLEGAWMCEHVRAASIYDAEDEARRIAELFGNGAYCVTRTYERAE